ncbi:MAG: signal peptidase [Pseudonocardiales bacterium]|jgi:signal peptidase I|nr:signal peptidase [Pseudonocardiales bacterium]
MAKDTNGRSGFWGAESPGGDRRVERPEVPATTQPPSSEPASTISSVNQRSDSEQPVADPVDPAVSPPGDPAQNTRAPFDLRHPFRRSAAPSDKRRHGKASKFELPILIVVAITIAIVLKTFVLQPFYIPSQSMEQTLYGCPGCSGDRILVFKPVYDVRDPHPGDIVVFKAPVDWNEGGGVTLSSNPLVHGVQWFGQLVGVVPPSEKDLVKRVIAVGGQTIKCCDNNGNVQVSDTGPNGPWRSLNEPYIYQPSPWTKPSTPGGKAVNDTRSFGPVTVPKGRLWVMGDHRSDSADSRYHCGDGGVGANCDPQASTVGVNDVIGKAVVIAWPPSRWRTLGTPSTFASMGLPGAGALVSEPVPAAMFAVGSLALVRRRLRRRRRRP